MLEITGNLWSYAPTHAIVIPGNVGWTRAGLNVMGAGVAKQAAERWPTLPRLIGEYCKRYREKATVAGWAAFDPRAYLIFFPVKPFIREAPWLSWRSSASLELIGESAYALVKLLPTMKDADGVVLPVALPRVGCGNGGLLWRDVRPVLEGIFDDRFTVVSLS